MKELHNLNPIWTVERKHLCDINDGYVLVYEQYNDENHMDVGILHLRPSRDMPRLLLVFPYSTTADMYIHEQAKDRNDNDILKYTPISKNRVVNQLQPVYLMNLTVIKCEKCGADITKMQFHRGPLWSTVKMQCPKCGHIQKRRQPNKIQEGM